MFAVGERDNVPRGRLERALRRLHDAALPIARHWIARAVAGGASATHTLERRAIDRAVDKARIALVLGAMPAAANRASIAVQIIAVEHGAAKHGRLLRPDSAAADAWRANRSSSNTPEE